MPKNKRSQNVYQFKEQFKEKYSFYRMQKVKEAAARRKCSDRKKDIKQIKKNNKKHQMQENQRLL